MSWRDNGEGCFDCLTDGLFDCLIVGLLGE